MDKDCNPSTAIEKEKPKEMKAGGSSCRTRKRKECDIPDGERCKRLDRKKNWRCVNARVNRNYCQHHIDLMTKNYLSRRERKKEAKENKDVAMAAPIPGLKQEKSESQAASVPDPNPCTKQKDLSRDVAITKRSDLRELLPVVMMDCWNEVLSPAERYRLRSFLPEGYKDEATVMSLLRREISRFGVGIADNWCRSVCEGKQTPDAVQKKERELKIVQSQYLKDMKMYHDDFIREAEGLKRLCLDTCGGDDRMFRKELQRTSHDQTVLKL